MMEKTDRIYDVLGEMLYVVAMADGVIQAEEKEALKSFSSDLLERFQRDADKLIIRDE